MNRITQDYIQELQADPNILGIILFGSWARGNNRVDSDVDLLVIVQEGFKRTVERRGEQIFEMTYTTEQGAIAFWQSNPDDAVELWNVAKVLFDRDGTMNRLQAVGQQIKVAGKAPLTPDEYKHHTFDAEDLLKAIEALSTTDSVTARMLLSMEVAELIGIFFDVRQVWTPPPKQRLASIKTLNPPLYEHIVRYYNEPVVADQIAIVRSIAAIVFDI